MKFTMTIAGVLMWWLLAPIALFLAATLVSWAWPVVVYLSVFWYFILGITIMVRMARWRKRPNFKGVA